jgi:hypothetical protein
MEENRQLVHSQTALFSHDIPYNVFVYPMIYVETCENRAINAFFHNNYEYVIHVLGKDFFYLPAMADGLAQVIEYNWPWVDAVLAENAKLDPTWCRDIYREILSYRIDQPTNLPKLPLDISDPPLLMRYESYTDEGHLFTLFPLTYINDEQFRQLLIEISQAPREESKIFHSTIVEKPIGTKIDPKDEADRCSINLLADEINQRIKELRLMGVKDYVIRKLIQLPEPELSPLRITKDYRILLPDYNTMEITMPTLSKVVYFFYLRHPEGLRFKELIDYREELLEIYFRVSNRREIEKMEQSIDELVDSTRNSINEKCSRIRAAFVTRFSDDLAKNYYITIGSGNAKRITLDRNLVIDESGILVRKI